MDLVVALDFRFDATPDGRVWTSSAFSHSFWTRYLDVFDRVRIVARTASVAEAQPGSKRADGEAVSVHPTPFYLGPAQYLRKARAVRRAALAAITDRDAVILRVGSELASSIAPALWRTGRPYGVEVVGDPYDAFAPGAIHHPLRPLFRWRNPRLLKRQCARACGASYVTESALQNRYPCPSHMTGVSDVELPVEYWRETPPRTSPEDPRVVFVGSLEQMYKGADVLLDAMAICARKVPSLRLTLVGEGRHLPELRRRAATLGIEDRVEFAGGLSAAAVRDRLDRASLFVLPSRAEGLPRAMLEAMARGLPCLGSAVGGIPELLAAEDLVPAGDPVALARHIVDVTSDPVRLARMSERNRRRAFDYREDLLRPRRLAFYRYVAEATEAWMMRSRQFSRWEVAGDACAPCRENV